MRKNPEWIARHDDQVIPREVRRRILVAQEGRCFGPCHRRFDEKLKPEMHHVKGLEEGGEHRESNLQAWCPDCHGTRTTMQAAGRALAKRLQAKRWGLKPPSRNPVPGSRASRLGTRYNRETGRWEAYYRD